MPASSSRKPAFNFNRPNFTQISESHCGPATIQMLLSVLGVDVSQEAVANAGGAATLIELNGMRPDQLGLAVRKLAPRVQFWYKDHATLEELAALVARHRVPVGVEWQGLFEDGDDDDDDDDDEEGDEDDSESEDEDYGHYSVVTHVHPRLKKLIIADPYKDYISKAREFSFGEFLSRWYDYNEMIDPRSGKTKTVEDRQLMFIITPEDEVFPLRYGMRRYEDQL